MGLCEYIRTSLSTHSRLDTTNFEFRQVELGKNGGDIGIIMEQHTTMFFLDMIGETLTKLSNISMDELKRDWREVQKEFDELRTSLQTYRMWAMKI